MSSLKERFENYTPQPDERVWQQIDHSLNLRVRRRRLVVGAAAVAVVAAGAVALTLLRPSADSKTPLVAQQNAPVKVTEVAEPTAAVEVNQMALQPAQEATVAQVGAEPTTEVKDSPNTTAEVAPQPTVAEVQPSTREEAAVAQTQPVATPTTTVTTPAATVSKAQRVASQTPQAAPATNVGSSEKAVRKSEPKYLVGAGLDSSAVEPLIWIPNAFAPDDPDPKVSQFKVYPANSAAVQSYEIYIYSRQGRKVFHSRDINEAWDGVANGHAQPMGAYVYVIQAYIENEGLKQYKGTITLIR